MNKSAQSFIVISSITGLLWVACGGESSEGDPTGAGGTTPSTAPSSSTGPSSTQQSSVAATGTTSSSTGSGMVMSECNPITNEPCDTAGNVACDVNGNDNTFVCYGPPNNQAVCQTCGSNNQWCQPSYTCVPGNGGNYCAKYCCDDNDCSAEGKCEYIFTTFDLSQVGVCMRDTSMGGAGGAGGAGGGGGAGGAGGGGGSGGAGGQGTGGTLPAAETHDCNPPYPSPSQGSCVPIP